MRFDGKGSEGRFPKCMIWCDVARGLYMFLVAAPPPPSIPLDLSLIPLISTDNGDERVSNQSNICEGAETKLMTVDLEKLPLSQSFYIAG